MEAHFFFREHVPKQFYFVSQIHLSRKNLNNQMAAVMLHVLSRFYAIFPKMSLFISSNSYLKYILSKDYYIAHRD